jgi:hypothetical protein
MYLAFGDISSILTWAPNIFTPIRTNLRNDEAKIGSICDDIRKRNPISRAEGARTWQM